FAYGFIGTTAALQLRSATAARGFPLMWSRTFLNPSLLPKASERELGWGWIRCNGLLRSTGAVFGLLPNLGTLAFWYRCRWRKPPQRRRGVTTKVTTDRRRIEGEFHGHDQDERRHRDLLQGLGNRATGGIQPWLAAQ